MHVSEHAFGCQKMTFRAVAFCLRQSLLLFWGLPSRLDWLAIQPRDPAISSLHLSSAGIMVINMPSWLVFIKKNVGLGD